MTDVDNEIHRLLHATTAPAVPAGVDLAAVAIVRGRRIRRRRTAAATAGSALTAAAFVTALIALPHGGNATVVVPAAPTATPSPTPAPRVSNTQILLGGLGPDFHAATDSSHGPIEIVPGSPAAEQLPAGYGAAADIQVLATRPAGISATADPSDLPPLGELCAPSQEKGLVIEACTPALLSDGRTVQVQHSSLVQGNYQAYGGRSTPGSTNTTTVYYQRPDNSVVRVQLTAYDSPSTSSTARQKKAAAWLPQWTPALESAAADARIGPAPGPATNHPAPTPQQLRAQQELTALQQELGSGFSLVNGTVELEFGSALEGRLPDRRYMAEATVTHLNTADMQKACGADLSGCRTITLPDGTTAHAITATKPWKSLAINAPTPDPGSTGIDLRTTVYEPTTAGQVIATTVELVSNVPMTITEQTNQTPEDKVWLQALHTRLAQAADNIAAQETTHPTPTQIP